MLTTWRQSFVLGTLTILCLLCWSPGAQAQYFGQNKVQYEHFDFKVLKTEHFDIYYYPAEAQAAEEAGRMAERWYTRLSRVFNHTLNGRQPVILYASHPDFEQTNVVEGELGQGTGGVTESARRRVTLPLGGSLQETDHVLGHELVHAFQYRPPRPGGRRAAALVHRRDGGVLLARLARRADGHVAQGCRDREQAPDHRRSRRPEGTSRTGSGMPSGRTWEGDGGTRRLAASFIRCRGSVLKAARVRAGRLRPSKPRRTWIGSRCRLPGMPPFARPTCWRAHRRPAS